MGVSPFKSCSINDSVRTPNPDPSRWKLLQVEQFDNAYIMYVQYEDCDNFEGRKIMVYEGLYRHQPNSPLDPHFDDTKSSPVARFKPDIESFIWAVRFAKLL